MRIWEPRSEGNRMWAGGGVLARGRALDRVCFMVCIAAPLGLRVASRGRDDRGVCLALCVLHEGQSGDNSDFYYCGLLRLIARYCPLLRIIARYCSVLQCRQSGLSTAPGSQMQKIWNIMQIRFSKDVLIPIRQFRPRILQ